MTKSFFIDDRNNDTMFHSSVDNFKNIHISKELYMDGLDRPAIECTLTAKWGGNVNFKVVVGLDFGYAEIDGATYHGALTDDGEPMLVPYFCEFTNPSYGERKKPLNKTKDALYQIVRMFEEKMNEKN